MTTKRTAALLSKGNLNQSLSEPDLASISAITKTSTASDQNITIRAKPSRMIGSPRSEQPLSVMFNDFRIDLMNMLSLWKSQQEESLASWRAEQTATMSKLVNDIADLRKQVQQNSNTTSEIEVGMQFINKGYEDMKDKIQHLEREKSTNMERLLSLERQFQDIHSHSRSTTIELRNVPFKENGKETPAELVSILKDVGTVVNFELRPSDLRDIYRVPSKPGFSTTPSPIVADFVSVNMRYEFLSSVRSFNRSKNVKDKLNTHSIKITGNKMPIYVDERVSPPLRKLLFETRKVAKENRLICWHTNGRIYLRKNQDDKPFRVTSERNIVEFLKEI